MNQMEIKLAELKRRLVAAERLYATEVAELNHMIAALETALDGKRSS